MKLCADLLMCTTSPRIVAADAALTGMRAVAAITPTAVLNLGTIVMLLGRGLAIRGGLAGAEIATPIGSPLPCRRPRNILFQVSSSQKTG